MGFSLKSLKDKIENLYKVGLTGNAKKMKTAGREMITEAQKLDPGSKWFGISGVPGVKSGKKIAELQKEADNRFVDRQRSDQAERDRRPTDVDGAVAEARRKSRRDALGKSGRRSTILTGSLGLSEDPRAGGRTLLGR